MARRDLTYVFNPVIHEPLSKVDCNSLGHVTSTEGVSYNSTAYHEVESGTSSIEIPEGTSAPQDECSLSGRQPLQSKRQLLQAELEQEALKDMTSAFEHKTVQPRKAMSLFLKAGKALVVTGQEDAAVECFESLIHLAKEQLSKIQNDKKQLPNVEQNENTSGSDAKETKVPLTKQKSLPAVLNQVKRTQSLTRDTRSKSLQRDNLKRSQSFKREAEISRTLNEMRNLECALVQDINYKSEGEKDLNTSTSNDSVLPQTNFQHENETSKADYVESAVEYVADVNEDCVDFVECVSEVVEHDSSYSNDFKQTNECSNEENTIEYVCEDTGAFFNEPVTVCAVQGEEGENEPCMMVTVSCTDDVVAEDDVCMVDCEFEMVSVEECDDARSIGSSDHVHTEEIVMHAEERIVEQVPMTPHQKALLKRSYVVSELIDTEQSYIQDLGHVLKGYRPALKEESVPVELRNMEKEIFGNLEEIYQWHTCQFFSWLRECDDNPEKLGDLFVGAEGRLEEIYSDYCKNKPRSDGIVEKYLNTYFKDCKKRLGHRLQLSDYLIKPVQRITKYQLMLKDILKHTEGAGEDGSEIQRALDVALRILKRTNDMMYVAMLQGFEVSSEFTGALILQNGFVVAEGKSKAKGKERRVFLFEKYLVICEPVEREAGLPAFKYIHSLKTKGLGQTESVDSDPCKWAVWMRRLGHSEIYVFTAPTCEEKEKWIKAIKECNEIKKKRGGFFKSLYRARFGESDEAKEDGKCRRISVKRKLSGSHKKKSRHPAESGKSERLKENIRKYRAEARWLASNPDAQENDHESEPDFPPLQHDVQETTTPISPTSDIPQPWKEAAVQLSLEEQRERLETEEKQLDRVLFVTRMITARLLQGKDTSHALNLYMDVVFTMLPRDELKNLEAFVTQREYLLQQCTETYDKWRKRHEHDRPEMLEESYFSLSNILNETAGFASLNEGSPGSVVMYTVAAASACREERWSDACQALYRVSVVYSALQDTLSAIDSLLDAYWICCRAEQFSRALQFLYNAFIRTLATRDFMRSLRIEQQSLFLVEKIQNSAQNEMIEEMTNGDSTSEMLESSNQATPQHLSFLVNMSRATRSRDWAWFEISEPELQRLVGDKSDNKANAILSTLYNKMKQSVCSRSMPPLGE